MQMILFCRYSELSEIGEEEREYRFHVQTCELNLGSCLEILSAIIDPLKFVYGSNQYVFNIFRMQR